MSVNPLFLRAEDVSERPGLPSIPSSKGADPLISRVTAILSASYSDNEFREALNLLDDRGITNDSRARRQLRQGLQKDVIDCNGGIIEGFGIVAQQLLHIKSTIDNINMSFETMKQQVAIAHSQTSSILLEASSLVEQRKQADEKQAILTAFKQHFIMSDAEITTLTSSLMPIDDQFFESLDKAKKIRQDCELLLGIEKRTLGLELMDQTSTNINLGFQKILKWVQRDFKTLDLENPQMNPSIRRALRVLTERPTLFRSCLDFFAETRERILLESFLNSLTGTAPDGTENSSLKPIDLTAHDPLRYVGDMLAWVHSATVSEYEALEVLFVAEGDELARGLKNGRDAEIWRLVADAEDGGASFNARKALHELVDRDLSGAVRILRQRMEQVIQSNENIVTTYKLASLIGFYHVTFEKLLGSQSILLECVNDLELEAVRQFRALMREQIISLQSEFRQTSRISAEPPLFLQTSFKQLDAIIRTFESSVSASESQKARMDTILSEAFDPVMVGCDTISRAMGPPDDAIFRLNYRLAATKCLEAFESTRPRAVQIRDDIKSDMAALANSQYQHLRKKSGLDNLMKSLGDGELGQVSKEVLGRAGQQLDDFLPSALIDAIERLRCLQDSAMAHEITEQAVAKFCSDFENLEVAIIELDDEVGESEESSWRSLFPRTSVELRVLLS